MSTTDPRRNDDGTLGEPATAVAANATTNPDHAADRPAPAVAADLDRDRGVDGTFDDRARDDGPTRTRVLPAGDRTDDGIDTIDRTGPGNRIGTERRTVDERPVVEDRRLEDDRPTVVTPAVAPVPPVQRTEEVREEPRLDLRSVREREKEQFGGMRFWLAFFGWLTATGLAVLLVAIAGGVFAAVGNSNGATSSSAGLQSLGLAGAIVTAVILFVAYYAGGYVAGRMARFSGAKQGVAVWLWAIIISVLAAIAGAIGSQFGLFSQLGSIAQVPINAQTLTVAGIIGIVAALVLSLVGAVLGGLAGMRFHRRVDRAAFGA